MQAIETKRLDATNTKGDRIKAYCAAGSVTISRWSEDRYEDAERSAVVQLCRKLGWNRRLVSGGLKNGNSVWVIINEDAIQNALDTTPERCPVCDDGACETKSVDCGT